MFRELFIERGIVCSNLAYERTVESHMRTYVVSLMWIAMAAAIL